MILVPTIQIIFSELVRFYKTFTFTFTCLFLIILLVLVHVHGVTFYITRTMLDSALNFIQNNPLVVLAVIFFLYKKWQASQPWPDFGGRIKTVKSVEEWDALLAANESKVVVVDAYATWCPPCKAAAPVFARMSEEFSEVDCVFAKFNTDEVKDLSQRCVSKQSPVPVALSARCSGDNARISCTATWNRGEQARNYGHAHFQALQTEQGDRQCSWL